MIATCPSRDELEAFSLGKLPDDTIDMIAEHLESCPACEDTIVQFDDRADSFVGNLHGPISDDPFADESACREAVVAAGAVAREALIADRPADDSKEDSLGRVGDYQLLARLGHGGMGTVYQALHTRMRRVVALKVLATQRRHDPAVVERFAREIEAVGTLNHPNIVAAHDAGEEDGMQYLVMEMIDGVDLHTLVGELGSLPVADACEIIRQAAMGVQHAHERGLVHRDLKPSNILLSREGQIKVLDLGLALLQRDQTAAEDLTRTGQVMGTLDYMAPEQADDSHGVDIRTDIYSLGCTLHKLLCGRAPFSGDSFNTPAKKILAHAQVTPPPIRDARPEVPEALADLIARMLAKSADDRPATPAEVAAALQPSCDGCDLPALAAQIDISSGHDLHAASQAEIAMMLPTTRPAKKGRPNLPIRVLTAVALLMLVVAVVGAIVIAIKKGDGPETTVQVPEGSQVKIDENGQVAVTVPEGQPADPKQDVGQHPVRGEPGNGLMTALAVQPATWNVGEEIELTYIYKNVSNEPIRVPSWWAEWCSRFAFEPLTPIDAGGVTVGRDMRGGDPFGRNPFTNGTFVTLPAGGSKTFKIRGQYDDKQRLNIEAPFGDIMWYRLPAGQYHVRALLDATRYPTGSLRLDPTGNTVPPWKGKVLTGTVEVNVSGVSRPAGEPASAEPTYSGKPLSYWVAQLKDQDVEYRAKAVDALVSFGAAGVDPLVALLRTGDSQSKVQALAGIQRLAAEAQHAIPPVIEATADTDDQVRERAAFCLAEYGRLATDAVPALVRLTKDANHELREVAVWALWRIRSRPQETVPALIAATQDEDTRVMRAAAFALASFPDRSEQIVPALAAIFDLSPLKRHMNVAPDERVVAAEFVSDPQRKELLVEATGPDYRAINARAAASHALGQLGAPGAAKLIELSRREQVWAATAAIHGLAYSSEPAAIRRLTEMVKDPNVWWASMRALGGAAERDQAAFLAAMETLEGGDRVQAGRALAYFDRGGGRVSQMGFGATNAWFQRFSREQATQITFDGLSADSQLVPTELTVIAAALLDPDRAKLVLPKVLERQDAERVHSATIQGLRFLGEDVPERDVRQEATGETERLSDAPNAGGKSDSVQQQVGKLVQQALNLLSKNPERGVRSLRAELERVEQLEGLDPVQRLALADKIESAIDDLQFWADRRSKWRTDVQAAIAEAKELAKTDPQAAVRRLYRVSGRAASAAELLGMGAEFYKDHDLLQLSSQYEGLAQKLDPKGEVSRRMGAELWTRHVQEALNDAMAEIRAPSADWRASSLARRIAKVQEHFGRCRALAGEIEDEQVLAETSRKIDDAQRQFADAVRWSFRNPLMLDSYDAPDRFTSGPVAWGFTRHGLVLASGRRAGSGPLDLWHGSPPVEGERLLGLRRLGTIPDAGWPAVLTTGHGTCIAEPAGIDGDTLTLRIWDFDVERGGGERQPLEMKWQLKPPISVDRAGSAVMHAHASFRQQKDDQVNYVVSLFLRLTDQENAGRSQLLFVRSPDGGKTWPDPPKLVADGVRWPGPGLRPVCFHPIHHGEDFRARESPDHLICLGLDEDNKAVFFRTQDGGEHWTKETVLLPDPETGKSLPGIPLASPMPGISLVYVIPAGDQAAQKYHLCHAWTGSGGRSWADATTIASDLSLPDEQLFQIRASTGGVTAVTCPVAGDGPDAWPIHLFLSIDQRARTWRAIRLDERLGGLVGRTALLGRSHHRIILAADVENPARTENRHQLVVQEISPVALEIAAPRDDEEQE